jgi:L-ribulose-5-phosphate 4-epimerase
MTNRDIEDQYEENTGAAIIRSFKKIDPMAIPAVLVTNHGPFAWGTTAAKAAEHAWMLEAAARTAYLTVCINPRATAISKVLLDRHFLRKHGKQAYYGQPRKMK